MSRYRICDAAVDVLKETDNPAVMWGDSGLLHLIAERAGLPHQSWLTEGRVLNALSKTPGELIAGTTLGFRGRRVRIFWLRGNEPEWARE